MSIADQQNLAQQRYVAFTTFTKAGAPKRTPVWIADIGDGKLGFTTPSDSWKARRLANDPSVRLQPSDARGNPKDETAEVSGTAQVVGGAEYERIRGAIKAKYGIQLLMITALGAVAGLFGRSNTKSNAAVVVTIDD